MKKICSIATAVLFSVILYANSTEPDNPQVLKAFNEVFKSATNPVWTKTGYEYKVNFTKDNTPYSVIFGETGDIKLISRIISIEHLPVPVLEKLRTAFGFTDILSAHEYGYSNRSSYYLITIRKEKHNILLKFFSDGDFQKVNTIRRN